MRRSWTLAVALLAGLATSVSAGEGPVTLSPFNGAANPAFRRWGGTMNHRPKPPPPPTTADARNRASETAAALRAQEEANLLRRMAVCDKLRALALETGDESLEKQAEILQQKSDTVFRQRTTVQVSSMARNEPGAKREGKR
jgi:hypothetical protein